jgi:hypothetical protein
MDAERIETLVKRYERYALVLCDIRLLKKFVNLSAKRRNTNEWTIESLDDRLRSNEYQEAKKDMLKREILATLAGAKSHFWSNVDSSYRLYKGTGTHLASKLKSVIKSSMKGLSKSISKYNDLVDKLNDFSEVPSATFQ